MHMAGFTSEVTKRPSGLHIDLESLVGLRITPTHTFPLKMAVLVMPLLILPTTQTLNPKPNEP